MRIVVTSNRGHKLKETLRDLMIQNRVWKPNNYLTGKGKKRSIPFFEAIEKEFGISTAWDGERQASVFMIPDETHEALTMFFLQNTKDSDDDTYGRF